MCIYKTNNCTLLIQTGQEIVKYNDIKSLRCSLPCLEKEKRWKTFTAQVLSDGRIEYKHKMLKNSTTFLLPRQVINKMVDDFIFHYKVCFYICTFIIHT